MVCAGKGLIRDGNPTGWYGFDVPANEEVNLSVWASASAAGPLVVLRRTLGGANSGRTLDRGASTTVKGAAA